MGAKTAEDRRRAIASVAPEHGGVLGSYAVDLGRWGMYVRSSRIGIKGKGGVCARVA